MPSEMFSLILNRVYSMASNRELKSVTGAFNFSRAFHYRINKYPKHSARAFGENIESGQHRKIIHCVNVSRKNS